MHSEQFRIRRATNADRAAVAAFCRRGDPDDYLPEVWDDWISEPGSTLLVGVLGARPVAVAHIVAREQETWFGGLRIAPEQRGRGFGRRMLRHSADHARGSGTQVLRLLTERGNTAMHALLPRLGFQRCFNARWYVAPPSEARPPVRLDTTAALAALPQNAPLLRDSNGLYAPGWSFWTPSAATIAEHLRRGEVYGVPGTDSWAIVMDDGEAKEQITIALAAGDMPALLCSLRALPAVRAGGELRAFVPIGGAMAALLEAAAFEPRMHNSFDVFALTL